MDDLPDISPFQRRLEELDAQMAEPSFYANPRRAADVTREQQQLRTLVDNHRSFTQVERELKEAAALSKESPEGSGLRELAIAEIPDLEKRAHKLRESVLLAMIPPEASDSRNTVMEIRAGTGGDEAALFAAELFRCYQRYADSQGWKVQPMSSSYSDRGGLREVSFLVTGTDVYKQLKWESGVHRVQRVPVTEASGRIHTSTITVAVLPEAEEVDIQINPQDLEITVCRASGPGGQGVNTTDSAVQILHKPTGLIVRCQDGRSQLKNKDKAMKVLRTRLLESQIGKGDRNEKIRTYNFPDNRITDHRVRYTAHNLAYVMEGDLDEIFDVLATNALEQKFTELETAS